MPRKPIVAVVGPDTHTDALVSLATQAGRMIAEAGYVLLTGGRNRGIMDAAAKGAQGAGGLVVGVLPGSDVGSSEMSDAVDIPIFTGMGSGRDNINALSGDVMLALGSGPGTAAEVSLALKAGKNVILLSCGEEAEKFFQSLKPAQVHIAKDVDAAMVHAKSIIAASAAPS